MKKIYIVTADCDQDEEFGYNEEEGYDIYHNVLAICETKERACEVLHGVAESRINVMKNEGYSVRKAEDKEDLVIFYAMKRDAEIGFQYRLIETQKPVPNVATSPSITQ